MTDRLRALADLAGAAGVDAVLITPGADLRYLTGYDAKPLERLTCLLVPATAEPCLLVPRLELAAARAAGVTVPIRSWEETDDPFALLVGLLPAGTRRIAVDEHMWAGRLLTLQAGLDGVAFTTASGMIGALRVVKSPEEIDALREAGAAIDRVHARMGEWLRPGRTEREVAGDIAAAIVEEGHVRVDFVIVGSGPHGASPHHEVSDRPIAAGEPVVVDIGGTTARGYCSDSTRNYVVGEAPSDYLAAFEVLRRAQRSQVAAVEPGIPAERIDAIGRAILAEAGLGELFIHRTGHGIGLQTHEEPYIVAGNDTPLAPGMAFSVEPGVYLEGRWGARIEDIVVVRDDGAELLNHSPRELVVLG